MSQQRHTDGGGEGKDKRQQHALLMDSEMNDHLNDGEMEKEKLVGDVGAPFQCKERLAKESKPNYQYSKSKRGGMAQD